MWVLDWLIYWLPAINRIPNLRFLSYICTLNVMCVTDWALGGGLWNIDGQGSSQSFGAGFKQMEASCVFWKLKASRRVSLMCLKPWNTLRRTSFMCILGLWKLEEEQASCAFWDFEISKKNKLHVFSEALKSLQENILHVYSKSLKALTKTSFMCVQKPSSLCYHKKL
jgi:hypothetical protein